jgi:hypothetical protein
MRLKEDTTNWRAGSLLKRDFRHDHSESTQAYHSHKPTNKWCRGKVGMRHAMAWHKEKWLFGRTIYVGACDTCGKRMYRKHVEIQQV